MKYTVPYGAINQQEIRYETMGAYVFQAFKGSFASSFNEYSSSIPRGWLNKASKN